MAASGTLQVSKDGTYTTAPHQVGKAGCHTYSEQVAASAEVTGYTHAPGQDSQTALVQLQPTLATQVNTQKVAVGTQLTDRITVSGLAPGVQVPVTWYLYGPVASRHGSCAGISWTGARLFDSATISVTGNGTVSTRASKPISAEGCYSYAETVGATDLTRPATHPVGASSQTTLTFRYVPHVTTAVSRTQAKVGVRLRDTVIVSGLRPGATADVAWLLYGPVAPHHGSCASVSWANARVYDRGVIRAKNGTSHTPASKVLRRAGCYTYAERINATVDTVGAWHAPGKQSQTSAVASHGRPQIPTGK